MYYVKRVNADSGEFALCNTKNSKRVYFDFNPNYYEKGNGGITNSLRKKFPIPRSEVVKMAEEKYFQPWWKEHLSSAKAYAKACFKKGVVDEVHDGEGNIISSRY